MDLIEQKPLLVTGPTARRLIGIGNSKYWDLVKRGDIKTVEVGRRKMVVYASLEALTQRAAAGSP